MPEVRELWDYWEESPPAHEMLQLIATSQFIGWKRPGRRKSSGKRGQNKPPGIRKPNRGDNQVDEEKPISRGKSDNAIVVDSKESMYAAVSQMGIWGVGKINVNRK